MFGHHLGLLILPAILVLTADPGAAASGSGKSTLSFDLYRDSLIVARGSAGSLKGLNFLLDTGASPTVLNRQLAQKLQLEERPGVLAGLNGRAATGRAIVPTLQFGPTRKDNLPVLIEDLSFLEHALPVRIDAVIGLDMLGQDGFEIDYIAREIHFGPVRPLKTSLPLHMRDGFAIADAELNHTPAHLLLDTGASSLILFEPKTSLSNVKVSAVQHSANLVGEFERKQVSLDSLSLGEAEFRQEPAFLVQSRGDGVAGFDGLINPAVLGIRKVAIDPERGLLEFSR
jgi:predicted aspartyl protease